MAKAVLRNVEGISLASTAHAAVGRGTRTRGAVILYDTRLGQIVKQVDDVGRQPYGIAVHHDAAGNKARH